MLPASACPLRRSGFRCRSVVTRRFSRPRSGSRPGAARDVARRAVASPERAAVAPKAVHDRCQLTGDRDGSGPVAAPFRDAQTRRLQPDCVLPLVRSTCAASSSVARTSASPMPEMCPSKSMLSPNRMRRDVSPQGAARLRSAKAARLANAALERERGDPPDPPGSPKAPSERVLKGNFDELFVEPAALVPQHRPGPQHAFGQPEQERIAGERPTHALHKRGVAKAAAGPDAEHLTEWQSSYSMSSSLRFSVRQ